jgi:hypothetical protein
MEAYSRRGGIRPRILNRGTSVDVKVSASRFHSFAAKQVNFRPVLSSERALQNNKPATI